MVVTDMDNNLAPPGVVKVNYTMCVSLDTQNTCTAFICQKNKHVHTFEIIYNPSPILDSVQKQCAGLQMYNMFVSDGRN